MFTPLEVPDEPPPVAIKHLDALRSTRTDMHEFPSLTRIDDCWTGHGGDKKTVHTGPGGRPAPWTGETWFETIAPRHPDWKQVFISGQIVKQTSMTPRPNTIFPHTWNRANVDEKKRYTIESTRVKKSR